MSMLPPNTSLSDLERVNRAIEPYRGGNNRFAFFAVICNM
ncbi:hypothetical protein FACS1894151_10790 [Spirochaetia bacterium]|nr:hypothetical protein FACS1894151_10790 [Spirochaetia bacterium]